MDDIIKYEIPIYGGELWVVFSDDFVAWAKSANIELKWWANDCNGLALRKNGDRVGIYVILIKNNKVRPDIIAHESLHVVNYIFGDRGIVLSLENDEHTTYFLDWIVEQVFAAVYKLRKPITIRINNEETSLLFTDTLTTIQ